jgi:multicomponent Na+:H+ antiporter subunit E
MNVLHSVCLGLVLAGTWLLLSGIYDNALILGLGVVSVVAVVLVSRRMNLVDTEGTPIHLTARIPIYGPWLLWEIMKSSVGVARRAFALKPEIDPTLIRLPTRLRSDLSRVIYANSITLTPGTVTVSVEPDTLVVHALTRHGAAGLEEGDMERRVAAYAGEADG